MPCYMCGADGALDVGGNWYCFEHLEEGVLAAVLYLATAREWDFDSTQRVMRDWLEMT
jgi:hypothetical protein